MTKYCYEENISLEKTSELTCLLRQTTKKRSTYLRKRSRILRIEVLLAATIERNSTDLRRKQEIRKQTWQAFKGVHACEVNKTKASSSLNPSIPAIDYDSPNWAACEQNVAETKDIFNLDQFFDDVTVAYYNKNAHKS